MNAKTLCEIYSPYDHRKRLEEIFRDFDRVLITSSFGTTSANLLKLLSEVNPGYPVHFIDTGYLFSETHNYMETLVEKWNINVVRVQPKANENRFTAMDYTWAHEPDACCFVNKVQPLQALKAEHDVWVSGMIGGTNDLRKSLPIFRDGEDLMRFYPLIDMSEAEASAFQIIHEIPQHPLTERGFGSVGCTHCTVAAQGRAGRWAGKAKTECGLHTIAAKAS